MGIDYKQWLMRLNDVSSNLMTARSLSELLSTVLTETRGLTRSDAGSIYRVTSEDDEDKLIFEKAQNNSVDFPDRKFTLPLNRSSIAGYSAIEGEILNISDVYELPDDRPYTFDPEFDENFGYRTKSMLVLPLKNREGKVRGVLQLINRKAEGNLPFDETEIKDYPESIIEIVKPFSHQAAVALERAELDNSIQKMIHSMIQTLVSALDKRDKITTGHSRRTAAYGYHLARAINRADRDPWGNRKLDDKSLRRLYYAGLLHDIGKIAVPETVLNKANRLNKSQMESIYYRLAYLEESNQIEDHDEIFSRIKSINQSGYLEDDDENYLADIQSKTFEGPDGDVLEIITDDEHEHLAIKRGNLTEEERDLIESHAKATFEILKDVAWTENLQNVPTLAASHHECIDGSGYPWGKTEEELDLISKILAVVDIYDALTARDRPYRSAMDHDQAKEVLFEEAHAGKIDLDLTRLFFEEDVVEDPVDDLPELNLA